MTSALFRPTSECGSTCLAPPADGTHQLRRVVRATEAAAVLAIASVAAVAIAALPRAVRPPVARRLLRRTARTLLRVLAIETMSTGAALPTARALVVANHISWLDVIALVASANVRIVAKSEVASWPIIGRLARLSGVIFIDRERPRTLPATIAEIRDALAAGDVVAAFAEGTTSCGDHTVPYRPAVFQAAIDAGARVVPVTLRYRLGDGTPTPQPAFIGDESLTASLGRVMRLPSARLDMRVGASLHPEAGASRRTLARIAECATPVAVPTIEVPNRGAALAIVPPTTGDATTAPFPHRETVDLPLAA